MDGNQQEQQTEEEKYRIYKQLCDMFTNIEPSQLRVVCVQNNWDVEKCLDLLVNSEEFDLSAATTTTMLQNENPNNMEQGTSTIFTLPFGGGAIPKAFNVDQRMHKSAFTPYRNQSQKQQQQQQQKQDQIDNNQIPEELSLQELLFGSKIPCTNASVLKNRAEQRILTNVERGHKVMVIMRGVPGSGKTHLAKSLINRCPEPYEEYNCGDFIFSTDNYFNVRGVYRFIPDKLQEYHANNKKRVEECCQYGYSPIIIDNTNTQIWEMKPYAILALRYGYILEILMPDTPWRNSAGKLAMKNSHGVPKDTISRMLDKFENCYTAMELLKQINASHAMHLPQYRQYPPFASPNIAYLEATFNDHPINQQQNNNKEIIEYELDEQKEPHVMKRDPITLLDLLKNDNNGNHHNNARDNVEIDVAPPLCIDKLERHSVDCAKENMAFATLRQIYPNCDISGLWDLFVKCNGDADWCVDLMLNEDDLTASFQYSLSINDTFYCHCDSEENINKKIKRNKSNKKLNEVLQMPIINNDNNNNNNNNQNNKIKNPLQKSIDKNAKRQIRETVENLFQMDEKHYSEHVRRVRGSRKNNNNNNNNKVIEKNDQAVGKCEMDDDDVDDDVDCVEKKMLKVSLGSNLIEQLSNEFSADLPLSDFLPKDLSHDVFVPRSMAKELYLIYAESVYNIMEEQRAQTTREDEDFARLLTLPQFEDCQTSPPNMKEILAALNTPEQQKQQQQQQQQQQQLELEEEESNNYGGAVVMDLATKLTLNKLCDEFPNIPRETLQEILLANKQNYYDTVDLLNNVNATNYTTSYLIRSDGSGRSMVNNSNNDSTDNNSKSSTPNSTTNSSASGSSVSIGNGIIKPSNIKLTLDEQKRNAIMDFEKTRNLAAHHSRLKFECYRKAKEAIQRNNNGAALYYSEVARMHLSKIDHYNHQSANCIMNVHKLTTSNPELLDMHYLHLDEALACLDIFIDRHISSLRYNKRPYKCVFIITGRGRHSVTGTSVIKTHVRARLKERCLR